MQELEPANAYISLRRAAELSGLADSTLRHQALARKLRTVKIAGVHLTTRSWLHEYLQRAEAQPTGTRKQLPPDYQPP